MNEHDVKRISRLLAIVMQLQSSRMVTASYLAKKFSVSVRTIYRDIRALEQAAVPIITEEGKGYSLMEGYRVPPIMFTESEANALVTAEQIVLGSKDTSLKTEFRSAIDKVKAVLRVSTKRRTELLSDRIAISPALKQDDISSSLTLIQNALVTYQVLDISYVADHDNKQTQRKVEPFALYLSQEQNWLLIAYCRLRKDYRMFRLDKIETIHTLHLNFKPHKLSLAAFLAEKERKFTTPDIPLS